VALGVGTATSASAAQSPVGLGTAASFAVLAGTTVTNTGPSAISGDLGVSPGTAVTGFPPGVVSNGTIHAADAVAAQAQADLTTGYNDAASRTPATAEGPDLSGQTLAPGVYKAATLGLTGTVTLDAQNDPNAVFVFQAGSTLITGSSSTVNLINGASPCNVFWQVGSSATLGTNTTFVGSILALTSATVQTGTTVTGRVLARNGQVSLDTNRITVPSCSTAPPTTAPPTTAPPTTAPPTTAPPTTAPPTTAPPTTAPPALSNLVRISQIVFTPPAGSVRVELVPLGATVSINEQGTRIEVRNLAGRRRVMYTAPSTMVRLVRVGTSPGITLMAGGGTASANVPQQSQSLSGAGGAQAGAAVAVSGAAPFTG